MKRIIETVVLVAIITMITACSGKSLRTVGEPILAPILIDNDKNISRSDVLLESEEGTIPRITMDTNSSGNTGAIEACIAGDNETLRYVSEVLDYNDGELLAALRGLILGDRDDTEKVISALKGGHTSTTSKAGDVPLMLGVIVPKPKFTVSQFKTFSKDKQQSELMAYMVSLIEALKKANNRLDNIRVWKRSKK